MSKKATIIILITLSITIVLGIVVGTLSWYLESKYLKSEASMISSQEKTSVDLTIPASELNETPYMGQTGIQYTVDGSGDYPYCLTYYPCNLSATVMEQENYYLRFTISEVAYRYSIDEENIRRPITQQQIMDNFTWRLVANRGTAEEKVYASRNGFLWDEENNEPYSLDPYDPGSGETEQDESFELRIYFLREEGLRQLLTNRRDISAEYTFAFSDLSFMWSTFFVTTNVGMSKLFQVSFDANGGTFADYTAPSTATTQIVETTGAATITLPQNPTRGADFVFDGWTIMQGGESVPFDAEYFRTHTLDGNVTVTANWKATRAVVLNANRPAGVTANVLNMPANPANTLPGEQINAPVGIPTLEGYVFKGWSTDPDAVASINYTTDQSVYTMPDGNGAYNLYAVWNKMHKIHWQISHGMIHAGEMVVNGTEYSTNFEEYVENGTNLNAAGYNATTRHPTDNTSTFIVWSTYESNLGWVTVKDRVTAYNFDQVITGNLTLYAYYGTRLDYNNYWGT